MVPRGAVVTMLKHTFVSTKADGADPTQVRASNWNEEHRFDGGAHGAVMMRDTGASHGAQWQNKPRFDVRDYGAVGDGATDDTAAIQAALNAAAALKAVDGTTAPPVVYFPKLASHYRVTAGLTCSSGVSVQMDGFIGYNSSAPTVVLTIGDATTRSFFCRHRLGVVNVTGDNDQDETHIGVKLVNPYFNTIDIVTARRFGIGVQYLGTSAKGAVYNTTTIQYLFGCRIGIDLAATDSGWVNENLFLKGECQLLSGATGTFHFARINGISAGDSNNNVFISPAFETATASGTVIPFLFQNAQRNRVVNLRYEGATASVVCRFESGALDNVVEILHSGHVTFQDVSTTGDNYLVAMATPSSVYGKHVYTTPNFTDAATFSGANTTIPGMSMRTSSTSTAVAFASSVPVSPAGVAISASRAVGVLMDVSTCRQFVVRASHNGSGFRILVCAFDANMNRLGSSGPNHPYVRGTGAGNFTADYGGAYRGGSTNGAVKSFNCHADVAYVWVGLTNCTARGFSIYGLEPHGNAAQVWAGYEEQIAGASVFTSTPSAGSYEKGRILFDTAPAPGGKIGLVCTTRGSFGTLTSVTGDIESGSDLLTVNALDTLTINQFISIVGVSGVKRVRSINGLVVRLDSTSDATVSGAAVAYSAPVFKAWGAIDA
jgi:hypothetical protein